MNYMTVTEAAMKWGVTRRRVQKLCDENRIDGILRFGQSYMIPKDANKPADGRIKSGKYIMKKRRTEVNGMDFTKVNELKATLDSLLPLAEMKAGLLPVNIKFADRMKYYDCFDDYYLCGNCSMLADLIKQYETEELHRYISIIENMKRTERGWK